MKDDSWRAVLGHVRERLPEDTLLIVMSDHGHAPYTRMVHLNAWLRDQGYLVLKDGKKTGHISAADDVDWSRTRAYGLGFNGLYLNLAGREGQGIVQEAQADELGFDCITEVWFETMEDCVAAAEFSISEEYVVISEDEERFMDRGKIVAFLVEERES